MSKKLLSLPTARIRAERAAQPREFLNESVCREYAELIQAGVEMPPIFVFYDGSVYWLASGFHRLRAHLLAGRKEILAEVRKGGLHGRRKRRGRHRPSNRVIGPAGRRSAGRARRGTGGCGRR